MKKVHCVNIIPGSPNPFTYCGRYRYDGAYIALDKRLFEYIGKKYRCRHCDRKYKESKK